MTAIATRRAQKRDRVGSWCWRTLLFAISSGALCFGCVERPPPPEPPVLPESARSPVPPTKNAQSKLTPLPQPALSTSAATVVKPPPHADLGTTVALAVDGFGDAVVAVAATGSDPHPVAIAAHANWDRPSWECDWWKRLLPDMFILCPRGVVRPDSPAPDDLRYTYDNDKALEAEVDAGLAALEKRFGKRITLNPSILWVALSRGAFLGARIAIRKPASFPRLILVEGGHDPWTPQNAKAFADGGGQRVHFVCGQGACTHLARKASRVLTHHGIETRLDNVPGMGHGLNGDADAPIQKALPWLLGKTQQ